MKWIILFMCTATWRNSLGLEAGNEVKEEDPPEGYYAFVESPNAEPPRVRPPPYTHAPVDCKEDDGKFPHVSPLNLCGDLNRGTIPRNPMGQNVMGSPYPFELIRNMTLKYLSRTLPILKADETLPKVAQLQEDLISQNTISPYQSNDRVKRDLPSSTTEKVTEQIDKIEEKQKTQENEKTEEKEKTEAKEEEKSEETNRQSRKITLQEENKNTEDEKTEEGRSEDAIRQGRKFCDQGGVFCMLYKAINGEPAQAVTSIHLPIERRDEVPASPTPRYEGPPTPCPAKVEYATPVFAKNYQGIWRYVVQIPYEGYFTQTVEVTRCLQARCHYLDGGCLSSPRWSSLLVAEIYYPETVLMNPDTSNPPRSPVAASQPPSVQDFQNYQQYLHKRAGLQATPVDQTTTSKPTHCDGVDSLGCFQVRLYYDWFLIPGSCKCWRPDYFNKYVRRKNHSQDL